MVLSRLRGRFAFDDVAQQFTGGLVLGGPFVVTEEVWTLAASMTIYNIIITLTLVLVLGYGILYKADTSRDPDREGQLAGIPLRYLSLLLISFLDALVLAVAFGAVAQFSDGTLLTQTIIAMKAALIASPFSMIGSATADSLF